MTVTATGALFWLLMMPTAMASGSGMRKRSLQRGEARQPCDKQQAGTGGGRLEPRKPACMLCMLCVRPTR